MTTTQEALALKYLEIQNIPNNTSTPQIDFLSKNTQQVALKIASGRALATIRAMVYNMYALARIRYYGTHQTSSLQVSRKK